MVTVSRVLDLVRSSDVCAFVGAAIVGASFELFKIHFSVNGVSFYTVFNEKQLPRRLAKFEAEMKRRNELLLLDKSN